MFPMDNKKYKMKYLLTLLFSFTTCFSIAQIVLSGKLMDEQQVPIEFANVFAQHTSDASISKGVSSDEEGYFELSLANGGRYEITVSFIGYEDWSKEIDIAASTDLGEIILRLSANELSEVMVTADRGIIEKQEDKVIFNVSRSPLKTGFDGLEVLQRSPNVFVNSDGNILMRNENARIMINGRITNLSGADLSNYLSNLQSDDIQSIQIQSSLSANVDAENSGGIINIILKKKRVGFDGSLRGYYEFKGSGDYNTNPSINLNYGANRWNVYGSYNLRRETETTLVTSTIDYYESQNFLTNNRIIDRKQSRDTYRAGLVLDASKNQVVGIEYFRNQYQFDLFNPGDVMIVNGENILDKGTIITNSTYEIDLNNVTLNHSWALDTLGSSWKTFLDYSSQHTLLDNDNVSTYEFGYYADNHEQSVTDNRTKIYSIQSDLEQYLKGGVKLKAGVKYNFTNRDNDLISNLLINNEWQPIDDRTTLFNYKEGIFGAYFSVSKKLNNQFFMELGLRTEQTDLKRTEELEINNVEQKYLDWFPSFYLSKDLKGNNSLSFSYTRRLRRPSFRDLNNYVFKVTDFQFQLGNPNLGPEYVHRLELSYQQKKQTIAAYYNKTVDAINGIFFLEDEVSFYRRYNSGAQSQYGVEYNRFGNLTSWWFMKASAIIYHRKFTNEEGMDSFERTSANFSLSNNFKINETINIDLSGYYRSPYEDAFYIENDRYMINLMVQKSFWNKKLICRVYFDDVFDTWLYKNERPLDGLLTTRTVKEQRHTLRLWVSYNFSNQSMLNKRSNQSKNDARRRL